MSPAPRRCQRVAVRLTRIGLICVARVAGCGCFSCHKPPKWLGTPVPPLQRLDQSDAWVFLKPEIPAGLTPISRGPVPRHIERATSDTIGHGDLASHRARARPAAACPRGEHPGTLAAADNPATDRGLLCLLRASPRSRCYR